MPKMSILSLIISKNLLMLAHNFSLMRSTLLVSCLTMVSRVLGFIRDMLVARAFGSQPFMDAFLIAFKIPNFMRGLFAEGAFSQAFVPLLSEYQKTCSRDALLDFLSVVSGTLSTVVWLWVLLVELTAPYWIALFAPGFELGSERFVHATIMLRWTFPYLAWITLAAFSSAILNTFTYFAIPAATPILLNVVMIVFVLWICPLMTVPIHGVAISVFVAGLLQCVFQWPFLVKLSLYARPCIGFSNPAMRRLFRQMLPALLGVSVTQINLLLGTFFASFLKAGSITWLYYSDRLMNFPLGVFGVAISTVILPHLSRAAVIEQEDAYQFCLQWALRSVLWIALPAAMGLVLLAEPILVVLFHYGAFSQQDVIQSARSLLMLSAGIPAFMLIKILASAFYAKKDIKTPVKIAVCTMILNVLLNLVLMPSFAHAGLALATTLAAYMNASLLYWIIKKRRWLCLNRADQKFLGVLLLAVFVMSLLLLVGLSRYPLSFWITLSFGLRLIYLGSALFVAMLTYISVWYLFGYRFKDFIQNVTV